MEKFKKQNGVTLKSVIIVIFMLFVLFMIFGANSTPGFEMTVDEVVAYTNLRNAIEEAKKSEGMTSTMLRENFDILGQMAINADSTNKWFSDTGKSLALYGNTDDSDGYEMTTLSDGEHCAIFYVKKENGKYYFTSYYFIADNVKGYLILVGE